MNEKHIELTSTIGEDETMEKVRRNSLDKKRWDEYRKRYKALIDNPFESKENYPIQLDFELNGTCNYNCESCNYRQEKAVGKPEISIEDFTQIITYGVKHGLSAIRLNYHNEPLMKRDICSYIEKAKEAGILDVYLSTNGSLLNKDVSKKLILSGLDRLQISIDAFSEATYEKIRRGGQYNKVVNNVNQFIKIRNSMYRKLPTVRVNYVRQPGNKDELKEFCDYWVGMGVDSVGVQDYVDWEHADTAKYDNNVYHCAIPYRLLVIRYNGDVLPCCMFESSNMVIGNIYADGIEDIWLSHKLTELRKLCSADMGWRQNNICTKCVRSIFSGRDKI